MPASKKTRIALYLSAFITIGLILFAIFRDNTEPITLKDAKKLLQSHAVSKVIVTKEYVYLQTQEHYYRIASSQVTPALFVEYKVEVGSESNPLVYLLLFIILLGGASIGFRFWQKRSGFTLAEYGKNRSVQSTPTDSFANTIEPTKSDVSFDDIGGISDVKMELEEIIDFMRNPKRYKSFGARLPRGVLLVGPPGVGKTMIAKAVAHAAGVPFYYQSGASFVQIYVGMGAKRVHELFAAAKKNAPAIVFIDEIDAVGKKREGLRNDEREATLNQLLTEMDGFEGSSSVIVIAATNKIDVLDAALLRAGRFDRRIFVELPTKRERASILNKYLSHVPHSVDVELIANMTIGFNGAALAALVNEAALLSLRQNNSEVTFEHFEAVKDKVMFGKKKIKILGEKQKAHRITYQAGKAVVAAYYNLPFEKLLLSNEHLTPLVEEPLMKQELEFRAKMHLAGMAASHIRYAQHSSSVKSDLESAKEIVHLMCQEYGMGASILPSEDEEEIMLQRFYEECTILLSSLVEIMDSVEQILLERESITKYEVVELLDAIS